MGEYNHPRHRHHHYLSHHHHHHHYHHTISLQPACELTRRTGQVHQPRQLVPRRHLHLSIKHKPRPSGSKTEQDESLVSASPRPHLFSTTPLAQAGGPRNAMQCNAMREKVIEYNAIQSAMIQFIIIKYNTINNK